MESWDEIRRWRAALRAELIARREAVPPAERRRLQGLIVAAIEQHFPELAEATLGFYWPFRGEIGLHGLVRRLAGRGARAALPVVVGRGQPLEFQAWRPGAPLRRGVWGIPVPAERQVVRPSVLLVPLVGFDLDGYRLGHGGGYYDRTLAGLDPRPLTIGVGFEFGRLGTIHPQPHDIPMDAIVTEAGLVKAPPRPVPAPQAGGAPEAPPPAWDEDPNGTGAYASPPCFMHELDPSYLGLRPEGAPADPPAEPEGEDAATPDPPPGGPRRR